jgi:hypothetical protein
MRDEAVAILEIISDGFFWVNKYWDFVVVTGSPSACLA